MDIAIKIKVKREEMRLTQAELAQKSGLTQATISRLENGEVKQLKSEAIKSLAKALGVTVDFLVGDTSKMGFEDTLKADQTAQVIFRGYEKLPEEKRRQVKEFVEFLLKRGKSDGK